MEAINTWLSSLAVLHFKLSIQVLVWVIPWAVILFIIRMRKGSLQSIAWLLVLCTIPLLPLVSGHQFFTLNPVAVTIPEDILDRSSSIQATEESSPPVVPAEKTPDITILPPQFEKTSASVGAKNARSTNRTTGFISEINLGTILGFLLVCGFLGMQIRLILSLLSLRRINRESVRINHLALQSRVDDLRAQMNISRSVEIRVSSLIQSPSSFGVFRPVVLLPAGFLNSQSNDAVRLAIIHELAHIKRFDFLISLMSNLVKVFYFYNPAVWYVSRQLYLQQEFTCDDWVLSTGCGRKRYAESILSIIKAQKEPKYLFANPILGRHCNISRRFKLIADQTRRILPKVSAKALTSFGVLVISGLFLFTLLSPFPVLSIGVQETSTEDEEGVSKPTVIKASTASALISPVIALKDIIVEKDVTYATVDGEELKLDIARPDVAITDLLPAIVFIHGEYYHSVVGPGWLFHEAIGGYGDIPGNKDIFMIGTYVATTKNYVGVAINYRGVPTHEFPAPINDIACAIRWLRAHSEEYGIDPNRIAVMGEGTGAHLALLIGFIDETAGLYGDCEDNEYSSRIQAVINLNGPTDLLSWHKYGTDTPMKYPTNKRLENAVSTEPAKVEYYVELLMGGTPEELSEQYIWASPITYVTRDDPPVFSMQSNRNMIYPFDQVEFLDARLKDVGVEHTVKLTNVEYSWADFSPTIYDTMFDFLGEHLK